MNSIKFDGKLVYPSKVVCVGRNYVEHIEELNNEIPTQMVLFNKPNSAITDSLKFFSPKHRFEGELCFLVKDFKIVGIGFGLDLTDVEAQEYAKKKGLPWERAKAFDKSAVFSHFIEYNGSLEALSFQLFINGNLQQEGDYNLMIHKAANILSEIGSFMSLEDYDIIMSGTPKGVSNYNIGDRFKAIIYEDDKEILSYEWIVI